MNSRTAALAAFAVFGTAGLLAAAGCDVGRHEAKGGKTEDSAITKVQMEGGGGDVTLRTGQPGQVAVHWKAQWWGDADGAPEGGYRIDGDTLRLDIDCGNRCSIDYDVRVPEGVSVSGENGSGDINLTGVSTVDVKAGSGDVSITRATGPVRVTDSSGDVQLRDINGDLNVRASSGDVQALDVKAASTDLRASSGDVRVELARPGNVRAGADSGDVTVTVPSGTGYRITTGGGSGDRVINVPQDPAGRYLLDVTASSGDVSMKTS